MRVRLIIALSCIFMLALQSAFAATIEKEFTFTLAPGETTKTWEVNVPLPSGETGKFIGRDFKPIFTDPAYSFQVVKEIFTENNYNVKVCLFKIANTASVPPQARLQVSLQIGATSLNDTPKPPAKIKWKFGKAKEIEWEGWNINQPTLDSAKYLSLVLKTADTGEIVAEQVIPVYLTGPKFPFYTAIPTDKDVAFTFQASNTSGKNSSAKTGKFKLSPGFAQQAK